MMLFYSILFRYRNINPCLSFALEEIEELSKILIKGQTFQFENVLFFSRPILAVFIFTFIIKIIFLQNIRNHNVAENFIIASAMFDGN